MKGLKFVIIAVILIIIATIIAGPYYTAYQLKQATENKNTEKLNQLVNFEALKVNLKKQLTEPFAKEADSNNPFAAMAGEMIIGKMLDMYVTPEGIETLLKGKEIDPTAQTTTEKEETKDKADIKMGYKTMNEFAITVKNKNSEKNIQLILTREGIGWKLTSIQLPL